MLCSLGGTAFRYKEHQRHMQKFGLQTNRSSHNCTIEVEIAREQASSLGRAGKKLRISLERYEAQRHNVLNESDERAHINEISESVWALMLQREFLGFIENNVNWVRENYIIPDAAIENLGRIG